MVAIVFTQQAVGDAGEVKRSCRVYHIEIRRLIDCMKTAGCRARSAGKVSTGLPDGRVSS